MTVEQGPRTDILPESPKLPEYKGRLVVFEGIPIQWDKSSWNFTHPKEGEVSIDTYSLWNPSHWTEIASRLERGQRCAVYIMGNYGVAEIREAPEWQKQKIEEDEMFDTIKKRPKDINFVAFVDPEDIIDFIDIDRLDEKFKNFRWPVKRLQSYAGPQHNIFPVRNNGMVNEGLIRREDNTIACFWIYRHWGFEGLSGAMKKKIKHGLFGGGSLNIHRRDPCYTKEEFHQELCNQPDWQMGIDFILFDEIAEEANIGRSQTMISFAGKNPQLVRIGSLSPEKISSKTGYKVDFDKGQIGKGKIRTASSLTPYDELHNAMSDEKVDAVLERIGRYKEWYKRNKKKLSL